MIWTVVVLSAFLPISLIGNLLLFIKIRSVKTRRQDSLELQEFLGDLMSGVGVVAVSRIDPENILLRSPKQR